VNTTGGIITGWGCPNAVGRTVTVNGTQVFCDTSSGQVPLPARLDGGYYFAFSAGMYDFASFYWY